MDTYTHTHSVRLFNPVPRERQIGPLSVLISVWGVAAEILICKQTDRRTSASHKFPVP